MERIALYTIAVIIIAGLVMAQIELNALNETLSAVIS